MRVISKKILKEAIREYPELENPLMAWYQSVTAQPYLTLNALKEVFPSADSVGKVTVFNIKGNHYRLITAIHYNTQILYVREVLTHGDYDKETWKQRHDVFN